MRFLKKKRYFFDSGAFTPVSKKTINSIVSVLKKQNKLEITNQSGNYKEGRDAQKIINSSRKIFAKSIGIKFESLFFMSCVSDGVFLIITEAIKQAAKRNIKKPNIVFGPLEHTSILKISDNLL